MANEVKVCSALDCGKQFIPKISTGKYCSDACRWRVNKRRKYKDRERHGLCKQCGKIPVEKGAPYCKECSEYFKKRYLMKKGENFENRNEET